jgi:hypothetical protein
LKASKKEKSSSKITDQGFLRGFCDLLEMEFKPIFGFSRLASLRCFNKKVLIKDFHIISKGILLFRNDKEIGHEKKN